MPNDEPKLPKPIAVEDLLAADDGPKPGILYLSKSDYGGVKMTDRNTFLGAGPDADEAVLKTRTRAASPQDEKNVRALARVMEARAQGRELSTSALEAYDEALGPESSPRVLPLESPPPRAVALPPVRAKGRTTRARPWLAIGGGVIVILAWAIGFLRATSGGAGPSAAASAVPHAPAQVREMPSASPPSETPLPISVAPRATVPSASRPEISAAPRAPAVRPSVERPASVPDRPHRANEGTPAATTISSTHSGNAPVPAGLDDINPQFSPKQGHSE